MVLKRNLIEASSVAAKVLGDGNHLVLFTDSVEIIGDLLDSGDDIESNTIYSTLFNSLDSASDSFERAVKDGLKESNDKTNKFNVLSRFQDEKNSIVYLKNVTIQSLSTAQTSTVDFLVVDLTKIVGFTVGDSSLNEE